MRKLILTLFLLFAFIFADAPNFASAKELEKQTYTLAEAKEELANMFRADIPKLTEEIAQNPNDAELYLKRGNCYWYIPDKVFNGVDTVTAAYKDYTKAIQLNPNYAEAYCARGKIYGGVQGVTRMPKDIGGDFSKAIELKPDYAEAYYQRAKFIQFYAKAKSSFDRWDFNQIESDLNKAIKFAPENPQYYFERAQFFDSFFSNRGFWHETVSDYTKALQYNYPNKMEIYMKRGIVYKKWGKYDEAIADYTELLKFTQDLRPTISDSKKLAELNEAQCEIYRWRAEMYIKKKNYDAALADYDEAINIAPDIAANYIARADLYEDKLKDYEKALADYTRALELKDSLKQSEIKSLTKKQAKMQKKVEKSARKK